MDTKARRGSMSRESLVKLQRLSNLMDKAFLIPGTNIRFGFDALVGLIPVVGDTLAATVSGYIYSFAKNAGVPRRQRLRMVWNIFIDWLVGLIPLIGDIFDIGFKANSKNVDIIKKHVEEQLDADIIDGDLERVARFSGKERRAGTR